MYNVKEMFIDVVIPVAVKDKDKLYFSLSSLLTNSLTPIRHVYLISSSNQLEFTNQKNVKIILEEQFPFTLKDLEDILKSKGSIHPHASWYYQQLLKLYVFEVIVGLSDSVLILDSDFAINRPISFLTMDGRALLARGYPFSWTFRENMNEKINHSHIDFAKKLVPGWNLGDSFTGMHHHIVLERQIMMAFFAEVQEFYPLPFWMAFMKCVDIRKWNGASEYVLYYHYCLRKFPHKVVTRHLEAWDIIHDRDGNSNKAIRKWKNMTDNIACDAVGCHGFVDLSTRLQSMDYLSSDFRKVLLSGHKTGFILQLKEGCLQLHRLFD